MNKRSFLKATTALTAGSLAPRIGFNAAREVDDIEMLKSLTKIRL